MKNVELTLRKMDFRMKNTVNRIVLFAFSITALVAAPKIWSEPSVEEAFNLVYKTGEWGKNEHGEGTSGTGSSLENAKPYMNFLIRFMKENNITSVVDFGCGDWQFSQHIDWSGIKYTGYDVVASVIEKNTAQFAKPTITFVQANGIKADLPKADLLI